VRNVHPHDGRTLRFVNDLIERQAEPDHGLEQLEDRLARRLDVRRFAFEMLTALRTVNESIQIR